EIQGRAWPRLYLFGVDQAVAAYPDVVVRGRQLRQQVIAVVVGDHDFREARGQVPGFGDDPNAGFRAVGTADAAADHVCGNGRCACRSRLGVRALCGRGRVIGASCKTRQGHGRGKQAKLGSGERTAKAGKHGSFPRSRGYRCWLVSVCMAEDNETGRQRQYRCHVALYREQVMTKKDAGSGRSIIAAACFATFCQAPALGHHSPAAFDTASETTVAGTIVEYSFRNPHVYMTLEVRRPDG